VGISGNDEILHQASPATSFEKGGFTGPKAPFAKELSAKRTEDCSFPPNLLKSRKNTRGKHP